MFASDAVGAREMQLRAMAAVARRNAAAADRGARASMAVQHANTAAHATSSHHYTWTGMGYHDASEPVMFDATFLHEPTFTFGVTVTNYSINSGSESQAPAGTATVRHWIRNRNGLYIGATFSVYVHQMTSWYGGAGGGGYVPTSVFMLSFSGVAYRAITIEAATEMRTVIERLPGFGGL